MAEQWVEKLCQGCIDDNFLTTKFFRVILQGVSILLGTGVFCLFFFINDGYSYEKSSSISSPCWHFCGNRDW